MPKNGAILLGLSAFALTFSNGPARAQMAATPVCPAPVAPTGDYAPWAHPVAMKAGHEAADAPALMVGTAGRIELNPTPQVKYNLRPEKPGGSVSYGGLVMLNITQGGTYRLALGSAAWLDVIGKDGPLRSAAHGHGPDCTGIRKVVEFALTPGRYTMQIAGNGAPEVIVMGLSNP